MVALEGSAGNQSQRVFAFVYKLERQVSLLRSGALKLAPIEMDMYLVPHCLLFE
jgi:hypothetical protein